MCWNSTNVTEAEERRRHHAQGSDELGNTHETLVLIYGLEHAPILFPANDVVDELSDVLTAACMNECEIELPVGRCDEDSLAHKVDPQLEGTRMVVVTCCIVFKNGLEVSRICNFYK